VDIMLTFLETYGRNYKFSQNREEGILEECLRRMDITQGIAFEAGSNDGQFCSNTALLAEQGWRVLFVESDYALYQKCCENWATYPLVRSQCCHVDPININAFVSGDCDVFSLDLDGADFQVFRGLRAKPKIIIIEIDSSYLPDVLAFNPDGAGTYRNTVELGIEKGFFLLVHTGNVLMVANEYRHLFPEIIGDGLSSAELYFNRAWLQENIT